MPSRKGLLLVSLSPKEDKEQKRTVVQSNSNTDQTQDNTLKHNLTALSRDEETILQLRRTLFCDGAPALPISSIAHSRNQRRHVRSNSHTIVRIPNVVIESALTPPPPMRSLTAISASRLQMNMSPSRTNTFLEVNSGDCSGGSFVGSISTDNGFPFSPTGAISPCPDVRRIFLVTLIEGLLNFGSPTFRIEHMVKLTAEILSLRITVAVQYNLLIVIFGPTSQAPSETVLITAKPDYDYHKLYNCGVLCQMLAEKKVTLEEATEAMEDLIHSRSYWPKYLVIPAATIASIGLAILSFEASWTDLGIVAVLSFFVQIFGIVTSSVESIKYLSVILSALIVSFSVRCLQLLVFSKENNQPSRTCVSAQIIAPLASFLPGLAISFSLVEIASSHIVSGTGKLAFGMVRLLLLAFGIASGTTLADHAAHSARGAGNQKPNRVAFAKCNSSFWVLNGASPVYLWLVLLVFALCQGIYKRSHPRQIPVIVLMVILCYWVKTGLAQVEVPTHLIAFSAAFLVGLISNFYSRATHHPSIAPVLCGVVQLVPGGTGLKNTLSVLSPIGAEESFFIETLMIALGIALGILASRVLPPLETHLERSEVLRLQSQLSLNFFATKSNKPNVKSRIKESLVYVKISEFFRSSRSKMNQSNPDNFIANVESLADLPEKSSINLEDTRTQHLAQKLKYWLRLLRYKECCRQSDRRERKKVLKWLSKYKLEQEKITSKNQTISNQTAIPS